VVTTHPTLRRKLRRDIRRSWPLFTALVVTVFLGVTLYAAANNAYKNLQASYDHAFDVQGFPDLFVSMADPNGYARWARQQPGVQDVRTRVQADLPFTVTSGSATTKLLGRIVGYPASGKPSVASLTPLSGASNPSKGEVLVEQHMADAFGLSPGDGLSISTAIGNVPVTVAGIASSAEYLWPAPSRQEEVVPYDSFGVLFVDEQDARAWSGAGDNQALVLLSDGTRDDSASESVLSDLSDGAISRGASNVMTRQQQPSNSVLQEDIDGFRQMAVAFPILFLSAAALSMYVLLTRRVVSERQIIGTLRASGVKGSALWWHYMSYGLWAGVIGAVLGVPLGMLLAAWMSSAYVRVIGLPSQLEQFAWLRPETLMVGLVFGVVATGVAAFFPARRAIRIAPAEAMRAESPNPKTGRSPLERIVPWAGRLPSRWWMVLRSIGRNGRRTLFTATGIALALILVLASVGLLQTMRHIVAVQFDQVATADLQALYSQPVTSTQVQRVRNVPGVDTAEAVVDTPVSVAYGDAVYATQLSAFDATTRMHGFITQSGSPMALPNDGVFVDESMTAQLPGLQVGDTVAITFTDTGDSVEAVVRGMPFEPIGAFVYASKAWLHKHVPQVGPGSVQATLRSGADAEAVRSKVTGFPGVEAVVETSALQTTFNQFTGLFNVFIGAMLALGGAMAFAIIFTTMSVNIVERERELATLRAAGVRFRTLAGLVGSENVVTAALGVVPGLALGVLAAQGLLRTYSNDQFTLPLYVSGWSLLLAAAVIMLVALVSQIPGLRAIRRMDIATVVRERSG